MAIKLDCPRCNKPLAVPSKKTGSYVNCPQCEGKFWVPRETPEEPYQEVAVADAGEPPMPAADSTQPSTVVDPVPPPPPVPSPAPVPPPLPTGEPERKTARFISAEVAQSTLKVAEDGQLPELRLQDSERKKDKDKTDTQTTAVNPLVLFGVVSLSVVLSILLVLYEGPEPPESKQASEARAELQGCWSNAYEKDPLKPYQIYLREAHLAYTRKDYKTERQLYRTVYRLLQVEGEAVIPPHHKVVLEEKIPVMLNSR